MLNAGLDHVEHGTELRWTFVSTDEQNGHCQLAQLRAAHWATVLVLRTLYCPGIVPKKLPLRLWAILPRTGSADKIYEDLQPSIDVTQLKAVQNRLGQR